MSEFDQPDNVEEAWTWFPAPTPRPAGLYAATFGPMSLTIDRLTGDVAGVEVEIDNRATWSAGDEAIVAAVLGDDDPGRVTGWTPEQIPPHVRELVTLVAALVDTAQLLQRATVGFAPKAKTITSIEQFVIWPGTLNGCIAAHGLETINVWSWLLAVIGDWPSACAAEVHNHLDWCCRYLEDQVNPESLALNGYPQTPGNRQQSALMDWSSPEFVEVAHADLRGHANRLIALLVQTTGNPELELNALRRMMPIRGNGAYDALAGTLSPQAAEPLAFDGGPLARLDHILAATVFGWVALLIASSPHSDFDDDGRVRRLWLAAASHWDKIERQDEAALARAFAVGETLPRPMCTLRWTAFARGLPAPARAMIYALLVTPMMSA